MITLIRSRSWNKILIAGLSVLLLLLLLPTSASAVPLGDATSIRSNFNFPLGDVNSSSYDGSGFDAFKPFEGLTGSEILAVNSFTGQPLGSNLEVFLLSEVAFFDGRDPNIANNFGVLDSSGNFISILDSALNNPGASGSIFQGAGDEYTFALQSPEALFSSVDSANPDNMAHIIAKEVVQDGEVEISPVSLRSDGPLRFQLLAGDIILFVEDMLARGNQPFLGVPFDSDFDYNDMVLVVRQSEIPEPSSMLLLGAALFGVPAIRKRRA